MHVTIRNNIILNKTPDKLLDIILPELILPNPKYEEAEKHGYSTYGIPDKIVNYEILPGGNIHIPRGYINKIYSYSSALDIPLEVEDLRSYRHLNDEIDSRQIKLRRYQIDALISVTGSGDEGILVSPAGSGKTVMGLSLLPMLEQKTLWLTHTKPLAQQVLSRISKFLPSLKEKDIGFIGDNKWSIGDVITIGMVQTLVRNVDKVKDLRDEWGLVILDECLVEGSQVLMLDGSLKDIKDVKNGDVTTLGSVTNKFSRDTDSTVIIRASIGEVETSPTHNLPYIPKNRLVKNKHSNTYKPFVEEDVLMGKVESISVGDFILVPEQYPHTQKCSIGNAWARSLALTEDKSHTIKVPDILQHASIEEIKNYLQVVFDSEGSITNQITLTMASSEYILGIHHLLRKFGIVGRLIPVPQKGHLRIALCGQDLATFCNKIGFSIKRKQDKLDKLYKKHANKLVRKVFYHGKVFRCCKVLDTRISHTKKKVYDFTTSEHLFVVNGVLSSNCHHAPATSFTNVIAELAPTFLYGLSATPFRRDGLHEVMFQVMGPVLHTVPLDEVKSYGGIIVPKVYKRQLFSNLQGAEDFQDIIKVLVKDVNRNLIITKDVVKEATQGNICVVITDRKIHAETLFNLLHSKLDTSVGIATGAYNKKHINETIQKLEDGEINVLVTTAALLGEGFDHAPINRGFLCLPFRNATKTEQVIGRIQRTAPGKEDAIIYDYVDNHSLLEHQFFNHGVKGCRYNIYKKLGCIVEKI